MLIESRGPDKFDSPFDRAMLESQRAFFVRADSLSYTSDGLHFILSHTPMLTILQIIQDVNSEKQTFLSHPQWREFLGSPLPSPVSQRLPSLSLRSSFCNHLVEIPGLLSEASRLSESGCSQFVNDVDLERQYKILMQRVSATYRNLELWYIENLKPLVPTPPPSYGLPQPNDKASESNSEREEILEYDELLLAVLDCVCNSVLIRLEKLLTELISLYPSTRKDLGLTFCPATTAKRQTIAVKAHAFVKKTSMVGAKLLEFGLQQLWSSGGFVALFQRGSV
jgi:hypothetical protein